MAKTTKRCPVCENKKWVASTREDGSVEIQRCDNCTDISDVEAGALFNEWLAKTAS